MKKLIPSTRFKKDLKRYLRYPNKIQELYVVLGLLQNCEQLPIKYKAHMLTGQYNGCMECHVGNDYLLIWIDEDSDTIGLVRLGSHSELFK
jgi:mRNA interferase YafQ